jgi:ceramide glucosyltransferase
MTLSPVSRGLYWLCGVSAVWLGFEGSCLWRLRRRPAERPLRYPSCSILKPLSGYDEELDRDLESHAAMDYPGKWELLLGLRDAGDPAAAVARAFAARHPGRVKLVVHEEEAGLNPKVNQLIALTRAARHEVIACTDANIRVPVGHLREIAAALERPGVGVATHLVAGVGERRLGAAFDNQAWNAFVAPNVATAAVLGIDQIVGKSLAIRRQVLEDAGGWEGVKDALGEDQQLARPLNALGLRSFVCATPVQNVQVEQGLAAFWSRQTRWAMIRSRILGPAYFFEPLLNLTLLSSLGLAFSPRSWTARALTAAGLGAALAYAQSFAVLVRGDGFRSRDLVLFPLGQLLLFGAWMRGATKRTVVWRGRALTVGPRARLSRR